jgi:hypothetical protein
MPDAKDLVASGIRHLGSNMYFVNVLPEFYEEVSSLLDRLGRTDLSSQLRNLEIVQRCPCTDIGCASFQVSGSTSPDAFEIAPQPRRSTFTKSVDLNADKGKIKLGLDMLGRITSFEILNRPDVRKQLFRRR